MELLKQKTKDVISGANVAMPGRQFLKPLDYDIELLVRPHPTLRRYEGQVGNAEVDPDFHLYPKQVKRDDLKDEIVLKNVRKEEDQELLRTMTKTVSGALIDELGMSNHDAPGLFGAKMLDTMPTNIRSVFVPQLNNVRLEFRCDYR